jgi:1,2-phenylacetyl-CoA epoxidase PaaB subunit
LPTYVVFENRKKRHDETLGEYYQAITLGTLDAPNPSKALVQGAATFHRSQITIDVVALRRASIFQQEVLKRRQQESKPQAQRTPRSARPRTTARSRSAKVK